MIAAFKGHEQIVQFLLEKGEPNVDFANQVILLLVSFSFSFSFSFFHFLIFLFFDQKYGFTPLSIAAEGGFEEIVKILIESGSNIDLQDKVLIFFLFLSILYLLFVFYWLFG